MSKNEEISIRIEAMSRILSRELDDLSRIICDKEVTRLVEIKKTINELELAAKKAAWDKLQNIEGISFSKSLRDCIIFTDEFRGSYEITIEVSPDIVELRDELDKVTNDLHSKRQALRRIDDNLHDTNALLAASGAYLSQAQLAKIVLDKVKEAFPEFFPDDEEQATEDEKE